MGWFDDNHWAGEAYDFGSGYMCGHGEPYMEPYMEDSFSDEEDVIFHRPDGNTESKTAAWCRSNDFFQICSGEWAGPWHPQAKRQSDQREKRNREKAAEKKRSEESRKRKTREREDEKRRRREERLRQKQEIPAATLGAKCQVCLQSFRREADMTQHMRDKKDESHTTFRAGPSWVHLLEQQNRSAAVARTVARAENALLVPPPKTRTPEALAGREEAASRNNFGKVPEEVLANYKKQPRTVKRDRQGKKAKERKIQLPSQAAALTQQRQQERDAALVDAYDTGAAANESPRTYDSCGYRDWCAVRELEVELGHDHVTDHAVLEANWQQRRRLYMLLYNLCGRSSFPTYIAIPPQFEVDAERIHQSADDLCNSQVREIANSCTVLVDALGRDYLDGSIDCPGISMRFEEIEEARARLKETAKENAQVSSEDAALFKVGNVVYDQGLEYVVRRVCYDSDEETNVVYFHEMGLYDEHDDEDEIIEGCQMAHMTDLKKWHCDWLQKSSTNTNKRRKQSSTKQKQKRKR